jgi:Ca2+-binding RTX toxin-like protein
MHARAKRTLAAAGIGLLAVAGLPLVTAVPAFAVTFGFSNGTMTITGASGNDSITVACTAGTLQAGSDSGVACGNVQRLVVRGLGGDDTVNLSAVTAANFPAMDSCTVVGAGGDDDIQTSKLDDTVLGGSGNDILRPFGGHDLLDGGTGRDQLYSANGHDQTITNTTYDGLGRARLRSIDSVTLSSGPGNDRLDATGWTKVGYLSMSGGDGNDTLVGGPVGETLSGEAGADVIRGGGGNDATQADASVTPSDDTVAGGPGHDQLYALIYNAGTLSNTKVTVGGTDTIDSIERVVAAPIFSFAGPVDVDAHAFDGDASVQGSSMGDTVVGGSGDDRFVSGNGADTYIGHGGTDEISILLAGAGAINVSASFVTSTSAGTKSITGVEQADGYADGASQTFGSSAFPGEVTFTGGGGDDSVNGNGAGTTFTLSSAASPVVVDAGGITTAVDTIGLTSVGHVLIGLSSPGSIDAHVYGGQAKLYGSGGVDTLIGTPNKDQITGFGGADSLEGRSGDDTLWGASGPDTFDGGAGFDRCDDKAGETAISCEGSAPPIDT